MSTATLPAPQTPAPPMTAEEFIERYGEGGYELVAGVVVELPKSHFEHAYLASVLLAEMLVFVRAHDLGRVVGFDTLFRIRSNPDTVRGPDISFYSFDRLPRGPRPPRLPPAVPDLAVEVRSPSNAWIEMFTKAEDYFAAGVRVVVIMDSINPSLSVCRPGAQQEILYPGDTFSVDDVLPGFRADVSALYA